MRKIKKAQTGESMSPKLKSLPKKTRDSFKFSGGDYKAVTKSKSTPSGIERDIKVKRTLKGALKGAPKGADISKPFKMKQAPAKLNIPGAKSGKRVSKKKK